MAQLFTHGWQSVRRTRDLVHRIHGGTIWILLRLNLRRDPRYGIPLFKGLSRRQIDAILSLNPLKRLRPGETLFEKGEPGDSMYAIVSGALNILDTSTHDGTPSAFDVHKLINRLTAGDVVGEMGFFRSLRRSVTAVAAEPSELLSINWKMIKRLRRRLPAAAQPFFLNLMSTICDQLENVDRGLGDENQKDDLTGLYNKQGFIQLLDAETVRAQRYGDELSLCLIGVDFEERTGRPDPRIEKVMLRAICQRLAGEIRRTDKLGRIDVRLFAMLAPRTSKVQAGVICRRLRQALQNRPLDFGTVSFHIRLTAGDLMRSANESAGELLGRTMAVLQENHQG